jgi:glycosyltransferase involved in cell wall biosynthesis
MVVQGQYPLSETRVQRQAEQLVARGYEVDVICSRKHGEPARARYRGVEIHRLPVPLNRAGLAGQFLGYAAFLALASVRLAMLHLGRRYRTVQIHNLPDFLVFCAMVPKLLRVPVVLDLHDLMPEFFAGRFGDRRRMLARLIRVQERLACRFADHVITVSEHWRETLIARGVPAGKCSVVMNVADERIFAARPRGPRANGAFRLLYHGTLHQRYGLDLAIQAVSLLRDEIPELRLEILGRGPHAPALAALRDQLGLDRQVALFDRFLPATDLPPIIVRADLAVVPYRNDPFTDELLPTKLMEYAALRVPCVAARTTAIAAYFRDTMVEFFTPGDAADLARCIQELHLDRARLAELARRSPNFTARFSWTEMGPRYADLLEHLAATSRKRRSRPTSSGGSRASGRSIRSSPRVGGPRPEGGRWMSR